MHAASSPGGLVVSNLMSFWVRDATEGGLNKSGPRPSWRSVTLHEADDGHVRKARPRPFLLSPKLAVALGGDTVHAHRRVHVSAGLQDPLHNRIPHLKYLHWGPRTRSMGTLSCVRGGPTEWKLRTRVRNLRYRKSTDQRLGLVALTHTATWVRELKPSLSQMFLTWLSAVRSERWSFSAIARLVSPSAAGNAISSSRRESGCSATCLASRPFSTAFARSIQGCIPSLVVASRASDARRRAWRRSSAPPRRTSISAYAIWLQAANGGAPIWLSNEIACSKCRAASSHRSSVVASLPRRFATEPEKSPNPAPPATLYAL